jgi:hypothetical protein
MVGLLNCIVIELLVQLSFSDLLEGSLESLEPDPLYSMVQLLLLYTKSRCLFISMFVLMPIHHPNMPLIADDIDI